MNRSDEYESDYVSCTPCVDTNTLIPTRPVSDGTRRTNGLPAEPGRGVQQHGQEHAPARVQEDPGGEDRLRCRVQDELKNAAKGWRRIRWSTSLPPMRSNGMEIYNLFPEHTGEPHRILNAPTTACGRSSRSESEANPAHHAPSSNPSATWFATSSARRVLPEPPGPVRVRRRVPPSRPLTSAISQLRPTKLLSSSVRLLGALPRLRRTESTWSRSTARSTCLPRTSWRFEARSGCPASGGVIDP